MESRNVSEDGRNARLNACAYDHVALLAGSRSDGHPVREVLPAEVESCSRWRLLATPALVEGCAAGDVLLVHTDGSFRVEQRGRNLAVQAYTSADRPFRPDEALLLADLVTDLAGLVETHPTGRVLVVTVPVEATFPAVERALKAWQKRTGREWSYGNVYAADGTPLNWW